MIASTLFLAIAAIAPSAMAVALPEDSAPPALPSVFSLKTRVLGGPGSFEGLFASSFHVGAGQSAVVVDAYKNPKKAQKFYFNNTSVQSYNGPNPDPSIVPFGLDLPATKPYNSTAPKAFNMVALNAGSGQLGFAPIYDSNAQSYVLSAGSKYPGPFNGPWVVCQVDGISPYKSVGPQKQLLYRPTAQSKQGTDFPKRCADVELLLYAA